MAQNNKAKLKKQSPQKAPEALLPRQLKGDKKEKPEVKSTPQQRKGICKTFLKFMFGHVGLLIIVVVYAFVGAYVLIGLETPAEEYKKRIKMEAGELIASSKNYITSLAWYHSGLNETRDKYTALIHKNLELFHRYVVEKNKFADWDGHAKRWVTSWTIPKSLLFTFTTMSTVGYGHIYPVTSSGQLFTMYYGMLGVPLFLIFLANIGDFLANSFRYIYSRACCRMCRIRRKLSELTGNQQLEKGVLWKEDVGNESYLPTKYVDVPIIINLCVIFIYLMLGGGLFSYWEEWTISEAVYFTFITLTTIGFGDFVPGLSSKTAADKAFVSAMKMFVTITFSVFGMALLSMAINLMQEQIVSKVRWLAHEMGVGKSDSSAVKYEVKKSEEGTVITTPADRDGNKYKPTNTQTIEEAKIKKYFNAI